MKKILYSIIFALSGILTVVGLTYAATTIGTNINTGGTFTVGGNIILQNSETIGNSTNGIIALTAATTTISSDIYVTGSLKVGDGTSDVTINGEDAYVEGTFEVDGASRFDGAVTLNVTSTHSALIIDVNEANAFIVRKNGTGGKIFWIDTVGNIINASGTSQFNATSTATALVVRQASTGDLLNVFDATTETFTILDGGKVGISSTTPSSLLSIQGTTNQLSIANAAAKDLRVFVDSNGKVNFNITATAGSYDFWATTTGVALSVRQYSTGDLLNVFDGTTEAFTILDGGKVGVNSSTPISLMSIHPSAGTDALRIGSSTMRMIIKADGKVGIASRTPQAIFSVGNGASTTLDLSKMCVQGNSADGTRYHFSFGNGGTLNVIAGNCP